jgi:hypothetical protein
MKKTVKRWTELFNSLFFPEPHSPSKAFSEYCKLNPWSPEAKIFDV